MISNKELGKYLKDIRESLGYSTHDVNKLCEISQSYISLMENGKRRPSPIILKKLSSIYSLDCNDLYEKAGYDELIEAPPTNITKIMPLEEFFKDNVPLLRYSKSWIRLLS